MAHMWGTGPLETIVHVGWSGVGLLVLELEYSQLQGQTTIPPFVMDGFNYSGLGAIDPFTIKYRKYIKDVEKPPPEAPVVNPVTAAMMQSLYAWNHPDTFQRFSPDGVTGHSLFYFNIPAIRRKLPKGTPKFEFTFRVPAAPAAAETYSLYYIWANVGDTFPGVFPFQYGRNVGYDSVWGSLGAAQTRNAQLLGYHIETESYTNDFPKSTNFTVSADIVKRKKKDFEIIPDDEELGEFSIGWDQGPDNKDILFHKAKGGGGPDANNVTISVLFKKPNTITIEGTDLFDL